MCSLQDMPDIEDLLQTNKISRTNMNAQDVIDKYIQCHNCKTLMPSLPPIKTPSDDSDKDKKISPINDHRRHEWDKLPTYELLVPSPNALFEINLGEVQARFRAIQRVIHPDSHPRPDNILHNRDDVNAERAAQWSAWINQAWSILKDPLKRAQHLLLHFQRNIDSDDGGDLKDAGFLEEILELQEQVHEAINNADHEQIHALKTENDKKIECEVKRALPEAFAKKDWKAAWEACHRLRYWYRIRDTLSDSHDDKNHAKG